MVDYQAEQTNAQEDKNQYMQYEYILAQETFQKIYTKV